MRADIVVVGSGPTGAAVSWRLATAGKDVLCLERGHWFDYAGLDREGPDWATRRQGRFSANPNIRQWAEDQPIDDRHSPIKPMLASAVGGSSLQWAAHVPRFRPEDFRTRTLDGVGADWPIGYEDLAPYFEINDAMIGAAFLAGDPSAPVRAVEPRPLPSLGAHGRRIAGALDALGWHWWPVDLAGGKDDRFGPCSHSGPCDLGCNARRRAGADDAYWPEALSAGARLATGMRVFRLETDADGRVAAAHCHTDEGDVRVEANRFILCANGLATPWLLLNSKPEGLANSSGRVGRNLMLHPHARIDGMFDAPLGSWTSGETAGLISLEFMASAGRFNFPRGFKLQLSPGPEPLALALGAIDDGPLPWGHDHAANFEARFDHVMGFSVCIEDMAEPDNRVTLSDDMVDADGERAPAMHYRLAPESRRCLDFGLDRAEDVLRKAGAKRFIRDPLKVQAGFHLMGAAQMGADPATSVTDGWGRCHDVPNLFIGDSSVFVTSGSLNPTATAQAFALRLADHVLGAAG